jgi:hypothetical protein
MLGTTDTYRAYENEDQFGDDFVRLVGGLGRYKGAVGAGDDAAKYFSGLKAGGYAEDPGYIQKGIAATNMVRSAAGGSPVRGDAQRSWMDQNPQSTGLTPPPPPRSTFAAINDTVIDTGNAVAGLVKAGSDLVSPGNALSRFIEEDIIKSGQDKQSDYKKALNQELAENLQSADGELNKAGVQLSHMATRDPLGTLGSIFGNIGPFALMGKGMQALKLAEGVRTAVAMGVGGGLTAGEVRGNIWEKIKSTPDEDLQKASEAYQAMRKGGASEDEAKREF